MPCSAWASSTSSYFAGNYDYGYEGNGRKDPSGVEAPWFADANDSGGECGVMASARFSMPGTLKGDNPPFWCVSVDP